MSKCYIRLFFLSGLVLFKVALNRYFCSPYLHIMALIHSFEKSGNYLFKNRGWIPVLVVVASVPVIFITSTEYIGASLMGLINTLAVLTSFTGFIIRAITIGIVPAGTSGRNTSEGQVASTVNSSGIYSVVRHPLYLGNYLMWLGLLIFTWNIWWIIIVSMFYWLYYERIMFAEERFLERKFGEKYMTWASVTPAFIPSFKNYRKSELPFSIKSILRREYSGVLAVAAGFALIDNIRRYVEGNSFEIYSCTHFAFMIILVMALILRTLKHHTGLLNEVGRS